jgi:integrase
MKREFTKAFLDGLRSVRPHQQQVIWDNKQDGLCVLVSRGPKNKRSATVTFRVCFYLKNLAGKPQYVSLGRYPDDDYKYPYKDDKGRDIVIVCSDVKAVRTAASDIRNRAKTQGIDPRRPIESDVCEDAVKHFIELHAKKNRSWQETQRIFDRYVLPEWRFKRMGDIDKNAVTALLDKIEQKKIKYKGRQLGGPLTASATLAQISALFNWFAARQHFTSPIVKGMKKARSKPKPRHLVLTDAELRLLWPLLDDTYGAVLKCALLTAQRFHKVSSMRHSDLKAHLTVPGHYDADQQWIDDFQIDNVWDAARDDDPKNKQVSAVPLSAAVRKVIKAVPVIDAADAVDFVFSLNGRGQIKGWSKYKQRLDARLAAALRQQGLEFRAWQHRDLRRTAKTLMMRAGVSRDISEHCLAHIIGGVEGTYDRYDYLREKRDAFDRLAALVERIIVNPPDNNVVRLSRGR